MNKPIILIAKKDKTGEYSVPGVKQRVRREPATWIAARFQNFRPRFKYGRSVREAQLQRVDFWDDTQEWVGIYFATVQLVGTGQQWTERYVFACRDGDMVCFRQFGTKTGWRQLA